AKQWHDFWSSSGKITLVYCFGEFPVKNVLHVFNVFFKLFAPAARVEKSLNFLRKPSQPGQSQP
ncbi:MAG: hypothetical protein ACWGMZ_08580, partial [Thermoguttaceae bacterium]